MTDPEIQWTFARIWLALCILALLQLLENWR